MTNEPNPAIGPLLISLGLVFVFIGLAFLPFVWSWDGMDGGYALTFVSGFAALGAAVAAWLFFRRAWLWRRMVRQERVLAQWRLAAEEWLEFVEKEKLRHGGAQWLLLIVVGVFVVLIGGAFVVFDPENGWPVLAVLVGVWVLCLLAVVLNTRRRNRRLREAPPRVVIGDSFLLLGHEFHVWGDFGSCLENAFVKQGRTSSTLEVAYSFPSKNGRQVVEVVLPVPERNRPEAEKAAEFLMNGPVMK